MSVALAAALPAARVLLPVAAAVAHGAPGAPPADQRAGRVAHEQPRCQDARGRRVARPIHGPDPIAASSHPCPAACWRRSCPRRSRAAASSWPAAAARRSRRRSRRRPRTTRRGSVLRRRHRRPRPEDDARPGRPDPGRRPVDAERHERRRAGARQRRLRGQRGGHPRWHHRQRSGRSPHGDQPGP